MAGELWRSTQPHRIWPTDTSLRHSRTQPAMPNCASPHLVAGQDGQRQNQAINQSINLMTTRGNRYVRSDKAWKRSIMAAALQLGSTNFIPIRTPTARWDWGRPCRRHLLNLEERYGDSVCSIRLEFCLMMICYRVLTTGLYRRLYEL
jgi:hypothetical protein